MQKLDIMQFRNKLVVFSQDVLQSEPKFIAWFKIKNKNE